MISIRNATQSKAFVRLGILLYLWGMICVAAWSQPLPGGKNATPDRQIDIKRLPTEELEALIDNSYYTDSDKMKMQFELGLRYEKAGRYEEALKAYEAVIQYMNSFDSQPADQVAIAHFHKAQALFKLKRYSDAVITCHQALTDTPDANLAPNIVATLYAIIGSSELELGNQPEAEKAFKEVIRLENQLNGASEKHVVAPA
jgi:tetratricopeptide (TPR) repeat protein